MLNVKLVDWVGEPASPHWKPIKLQAGRNLINETGMIPPLLTSLHAKGSCGVRIRVAEASEIRKESEGYYRRIRRVPRDNGITQAASDEHMALRIFLSPRQVGGFQ